MKSKDVEMSRLLGKLRQVLGEEADVLVESLMKLESASFDSSNYGNTEQFESRLKASKIIHEMKMEQISSQTEIYQMFTRNMWWTLWMLFWTSISIVAILK